MRIEWFMELLPLGAIARLLGGLQRGIMQEECAGLSGPGYYATEPHRDVRDVPVRTQPSFASLDRAVTARSGRRVTAAAGSGVLSALVAVDNSLGLWIALGALNRDWCSSPRSGHSC